MFKFKSERVDHCFGETSVNPFRQCWSMEGWGASGIRIFFAFILHFYKWKWMLFHCESANDLFSWRRITELFSPCLCASKKKKNKRQIQWFGLTITNISLSIFSHYYFTGLEGSPCSDYTSISKIYTEEDLGQLKCKQHKDAKLQKHLVFGIKLHLIL